MPYLKISALDSCFHFQIFLFLKNQPKCYTCILVVKRSLPSRYFTFLTMLPLCCVAVDETKNHQRIKCIQNIRDNRHPVYNSFDLLSTLRVSVLRFSILRKEYFPWTENYKLNLSFNWEYSTTMCFQGKALRVASKESET